MNINGRVDVNYKFGSEGVVNFPGPGSDVDDYLDLSSSIHIKEKEVDIVRYKKILISYSCNIPPRRSD